MAGHEDRNGIRSTRATDRTNRFGIPNRLRDLRVAPGAAPADLAQGPPYALLEGCAAGKIERWHFFRWAACECQLEGLANSHMPPADLGCRHGLARFGRSLPGAWRKLQTAQASRRIVRGELPIGGWDRHPASLSCNVVLHSRMRSGARIARWRLNHKAAGPTLSNGFPSLQRRPGRNTRSVPSRTTSRMITKKMKRLRATRFS